MEGRARTRYQCTSLRDVLSSRQYSRCEPYRPGVLYSVIESHVSRGAPIELFGLWGIGERPSAGLPDRAACEQFQRLLEDIAACYPPGAKASFVIATGHGRHNGYPEESIDSYARDIESLMDEFTFTHSRLDELWRVLGIDLGVVEETWKSSENGWWHAVPNADDLEARASKHNRRLPARMAAQQYVVMRRLELEGLERLCGSRVFHTYSDEGDRHLFPMVPVLHLHSIRRGTAHPPWFMDDETARDRLGTGSRDDTRAA